MANDSRPENAEADSAWNYFSSDSEYSDVLKDRLQQEVEMDSALAMAGYLEQFADADLDIVDFGGGPGHYYPVIERNYSKGAVSYTSVDIDADNIAFGKKYFVDNPRAAFKVGSVLSPEEFLVGRNCVVSANTLPHVPAIAPLLRAIDNSAGIDVFLFRMLIGEECVQIKKHLSGTSFDGLFERGYQHNNIYSVPYVASVLGPDWQLTRLPDVYDADRLAAHSVPMQESNAFYGNRVSRPVGGMIFKGDIYMPWAFLLGRRAPA